MCWESIIALEWFCDNDWPSGDECHCTCTNGEHTHDNPYYGSGDCDYSWQCETPCDEWCDSQNPDPLDLMYSPPKDRKGGRIKRFKRRRR